MIRKLKRGQCEEIPKDDEWIRQKGGGKVSSLGKITPKGKQAWLRNRGDNKRQKGTAPLLKYSCTSVDRQMNNSQRRESWKPRRK